MIAVLSVLGLAGMIGNTVLVFFEILRSPPKMFCDCGATHRWFLPGVHFLGRLIMVRAVMVTVAAVSSIFDDYSMFSRVFLLSIWGGLSAMYWYAWWIHEKNSRKKLKDKVLGRVKVTLAGLRIVPIPHGAGA